MARGKKGRRRGKKLTPQQNRFKRGAATVKKKCFPARDWTSYQRCVSSTMKKAL